MDIKVMGMLLLIVCTLFNSILALNHTSAEAECREDGGLESYEHFIGDEGSGLDKGYDLKEDESAWISGYVKFSKLVAYHGCLSNLKDESSVLSYRLKENNIYNCLQKCTLKVNISYIGLCNEFCYCTRAHEFENFDLQPDEYCYQELMNSNLIPRTYVSSIEANITFYTIISNTRLSWDQPFSEARRQCVKVRYDGEDFKYETDSCFSKVDNFICANSAYHNTLIGNCRLQQLSVSINNVSNFWMTSFKECLEFKGKLIPFVYTKIKRCLTANKLYWTGIFRSFKIENKNEFAENDVCLSLKNVSGKIVLDPSDCSARKEKYICKGNFTKRIKFTSIKTNGDSKLNSVSVRTITATTVVENTSITSATKPVSLETISPTQTKIEDGKPDLIGVYIAVGVVVAISLVIIIMCGILLKRKRSKATSTTIRRSSKAQDNVVTENIKDASNADVAQRQVLAHHSVKEEVTYAKPDIAFKKISSSDSDYDRIRIKGPGERKEKTAKAKTIEDHVYGFNSAYPIDIEVYDHLEAAHKMNVSKPTDGIYNTLAEDSETYKVLGLGNKEESSKSVVNQTQMKGTCPTYDKLK